MMDDDFFDEGYDGVDDNIEIILEGAREDDGQSYIYVRIKKKPDDKELFEESWDGSVQAKDNMCTVLANGTIDQYAVIMLNLFLMDEAFIHACTAAVRAYHEIINMEN